MIEPAPVTSLVCHPADLRTLAERVAESATLALSLIAAGTLLAALAFLAAPRARRALARLRAR